MTEKNRSGAKQELVLRAKKYIRENYTEKFSLDDLAGALYINKVYLCRTFKEVTGDTLLHHFNSVRCEQAARLLAESAHSIQIIGSEVGYATPSHFARIFREQYGCTPSEYRRRHQESL